MVWLFLYNVTAVIVSILSRFTRQDREIGGCMKEA